MGKRLDLNHRYRNFAGAHPRAINGLFQVIYRMATRGSPPTHVPGDAEALTLSGGTVTTSYHSRFSVRQIVHAIAAPIRFVECQAIETSLFFALASDGSTDRLARGWGAKKFAVSPFFRTLPPLGVVRPEKKYPTPMCKKSFATPIFF